MSSWHASRHFLDDQAVRDAEAATKDEEEEEAYDSFDLLIGIKFSRHSTDLHEKPGSSYFRRPRAQSVESNNSSFTTDLLITPSQAASPGASTSYAELTDSQERRLARLLGADPAISPLSPDAIPEESNDTPYANLGCVDNHPSLPSFNSLLQSLEQPLFTHNLSPRQHASTLDSDANTVGDSEKKSDRALSPTTPSLPGKDAVQDLNRPQEHGREAYTMKLLSHDGSQNRLQGGVALPRSSGSKRSRVNSLSRAPIHYPADLAVHQALVNLRPRTYTAGRTTKMPSVIPNQDRTMSSTIDGGNRTSRLSKEAILVYGPQTKKRRTSNSRASQATAPPQDRALYDSPLSQETILEIVRQATATWSAPSQGLPPGAALLGLEEISKGASENNEPPRIFERAPYIRGTSILSARSSGAESPPTTPDLLLVDLVEDRESDSSDEVLAGNEDCGK